MITADQVGSRRGPDLVDDALAAIRRHVGERLALPPDRTAGDEIQAMTAEPAAAFELILLLTRSRQWSVGCGIGAVQTPLPTETRAGTGDAFVLAREAVEAAKGRPTRFAAAVAAGNELTADDVEPLVDLLLTVRARRSDEGWQLGDLISAGLSQNAAAERLGVTPQAVSQRARSAHLRLEKAAIPALVRVLDLADRKRVAS